MTNRICLGFWEGAAHTTARARGAKGQREASSTRPALLNRGAPSCKIPRSIIFYSHVDSNYCLFPAAEWMRNFFHLLESWQFDNHRATAALRAAKVLNRLHFFFLAPWQSRVTISAIIFHSFLCLDTIPVAWLILFPRANTVHPQCNTFDETLTFSQAKKGENANTYVSFRISRWSSQWSTHDTMSKPTILNQRERIEWNKNKFFSRFLHSVYSYVTPESKMVTLKTW